MPHVFTYGTLMFPQVFERVVQRRYHHAQASVKHLQRSSMHQQCYPVVVPNRLAPELEGIVYFDIGIDDLRRLDTFEGSYYRRQAVEVALTAENTQVGAEIYILRPGYRHLASGREWSPQRFQRDHLRRFCRTFCRR